MKLLKTLGAAIAIGALTGACHADITTVTHTHMDMPQMHAGSMHMTPEQQAQIDRMSASTTYMSGHKMRTDTALMTILSDADAGKTWMLNNTAHTYSLVTFDPAKMKAMLFSNSKSSGGPAGAPDYKVTDTGRTTKILGHLARHYIIHMTMNIQGRSTTITSDILAAQDLPAADLGMYSGMAHMTGGLANMGGGFRGLPLVTTTKMQGGVSDGFTMKQTVTSLSLDPIPASKFTIPEGYAQTETKDMLPKGTSIAPAVNIP